MFECRAIPIALGIALALRKANLLAEILAYNKSALCRSASLAFSFVSRNVYAFDENLQTTETMLHTSLFVKTFILHLTSALLFLQEICGDSKENRTSCYYVATKFLE